MYEDMREDIELFRASEGKPHKILKLRLERRYGSIERAMQASQLSDPLSFMSCLNDRELEKWYLSEGIVPIRSEMRRPIDDVIREAHACILDLSRLGFCPDGMLEINMRSEEGMKKVARMLRDEGARHLRKSREFRLAADSLEFHAERIRLKKVYTKEKRVYNRDREEIEI